MTIKENENKNHKINYHIEYKQLKELIYSFLYNKAKSTQIVYQGHLKEFFNFLSDLNILSIKDVRFVHLSAYKDYLITKKLKDNTINIKLNTIKSFFKFLNQPFDEKGSNYLQNNIAQYIKNQQIDPYSFSQTFNLDLFKKIIYEIKTDSIKGLRDKIIFLLFGYTGLRKSEVINLKVNSIYYEMGIPYYKVKGKGNKLIEKELPEEVYNLIIELVKKMKLNKNDYLFSNLSNSRQGNHKKLSPSALNKILNNYVKQCGISDTYRVHSLRSMSAIEVYKKTKDIVVVQNHLNHKLINTTQIYLNKMTSKRINYYDQLFH